MLSGWECCCLVQYVVVCRRMLVEYVAILENVAERKRRMLVFREERWCLLSNIASCLRMSGGTENVGVCWWLCVLVFGEDCWCLENIGVWWKMLVFGDSCSLGVNLGENGMLGEVRCSVQMCERKVCLENVGIWVWWGMLLFGEDCYSL